MPSAIPSLDGHTFKFKATISNFNWATGFCSETQSKLTLETLCIAVYGIPGTSESTGSYAVLAPRLHYEGTPGMWARFNKHFELKEVVLRVSCKSIELILTAEPGLFIFRESCVTGNHC